MYIHTEEVNRIALSSNDDKILQSYDEITTYPYGTSAVKICKTEMLSRVNINDYNFDCYTNENKTKHIQKWPYILNHPYRVLIE